MNNVQNKLINIIINSTSEKLKRNIYVIGTAISLKTGNMDANDKERYDRIIKKL